MKCWCIIDLSHLGGFRFFRGKSAARQDKDKGPTMFYDTLGDAVAELFRLQQEHADGEFFLFESMAQVCPVETFPGAWHLEQIGGHDA